ncbi:MAG: hypothetical protein ACKODN_01750, partial [Actinomycetota bacterium]
MSVRPARRGLVVGLVALVAALAGPVAPASAATLVNPTFSPLDENTSFAPDGDITLTFAAGKTMSAVTGGSLATLTNLLTNTAAPHATSFSSNVVTLNPTADLSGCTPYRLSFTNTPGAAYKDNQATPDTWPGASTSITFLTAATSGICGNAAPSGAGTTAGGVKAVGDPATLFGVCFPNTISVFNGGADANITATTNTRAGGLAFTGVVTSGSGGTNNCLQFSLTVANTDISQQPLRVTAVNLSNGAWIVEAQPSGSPKTRTTSITGLNLTVAGQTNGPVEVNAKPNVVAFSPVNGDTTVKRDAVVTLTFNEAIRLVATKVINLRKDGNTNGSFDAGDTVLESFTIPTYVNAGTGANTTNNEYHSTSNETRIQVAGSLACQTCSTLTLRPNLDMDAAATYYLEIPSDAIVDTTSGTALAYAGLNTSGTLTHKFTTVADGASAWTSGPSIYQIDSTQADGSYKVGQALFNVRLQFSSPVSLDGSSTAALKLNVVSGGFTTPNCTLTDSVTLDCPYTIATGHNSSNTALTYFSANRRNLNVASATALTVTGGTGFKGTGTGTPAASLTLPVYGSYSLGDGKAIKIDTTAPVRLGSNPPVADAFMQGLITVARNSNFLMFFDPSETLSLGSNKNLRIKSFVDGATLETINTSTDAAKVTFSGQQVTVNPTANLIGPNVAVSGATRTGNSVVYATGSTDHGFKAPRAITGASYSSNVVTLTVASGHGLIVNDRISVAGLVGAGGSASETTAVNGVKQVSAQTATTVSYAVTGVTGNPTLGATPLVSDSVIVTNAGTNYSTSGPNHCIVSAVDTDSTPKTFTCDVVTAGSTNGSATFSPAAAAGLQPETAYYITYEAGFFKDAAGNDIAALST